MNKNNYILAYQKQFESNRSSPTKQMESNTSSPNKSTKMSKAAVSDSKFKHPSQNSSKISTLGVRTEVVKIHNFFFLFRMNPSLSVAIAEELFKGGKYRILNQ